MATPRRAQRATHEPRACPVCGDPFTPTRSDALTCGATCRKRKERGWGGPWPAAEKSGRPALRRGAPPADGRCQCCGELAPPRANGSSGLNLDHRHDNNLVRGWVCTRCNTQLGTLDLAFTDPDRFAALKAWSVRNAPVTPARSPRPDRKVRRAADPTLFGDR